MSDKKHIDRLFQEKFKNFEVTPDAAVWENIHDALHKNKRTRRVIPVWWFTAGIAAVLVMMLAIGNVFNTGGTIKNPENNRVGTETTRGASVSDTTKDDKNETSGSIGIENNDFNVIANTEPSESIKGTNSKKDISNKIADNPDKVATQLAGKNSDGTQSKTISQEELTPSQKENMIIGTDSNKEAIAKHNSKLPQREPNNDVVHPSQERTKTSPEKGKEPTQIAKHIDQNTIKDTEIAKDYKDIIASNKEDESIEYAIAKANPINKEEKEEPPTKWNISPNVAPVYFNSLGKGSSIDNQFVNNGKSGDVNMSYGISGSYAINDKIKIRAGVNKVELGYSTNGVIALKDVNNFNVNSKSSDLRNINFNRLGKMDAYMSTSNINKESAPQFVVYDVKGALEQQFGYIEVPLEVEYNLLNKKFGLNVIGGFSTLFLNNNAIYSVLENERSLLGDANNINTTSYSANFGLGLNYNISHTLKLNIEPMFKYQINTFNNTSGDFRPYFIGVYSGFSFKF